jgi:hypothetical protein
VESGEWRVVSGEKAMDVGTIVELLLIAFGGGAAWGTLRARLKSLDEDLKDVKENHIHGIRKALERLPCREQETCPQSLAPSP